ncbi:hypothetical protein P9847_04555 [Paenibacillus chibensis]|uniref:Uncharacterized protein n=1 Tax=Paenibacillus chibensis TaxID=59846 RepID=A0ABU6PNY4_9BACL|nr:hypothetical protein [Paenibacillus chibensis]
MKNLGISLICISAFLYGIRYLSAAIYGSNTQTWSKELFNAMLDYVGRAPLVLSCISLAAGILIIILSGTINRIKLEYQQIKENWNKDLDGNG